ncbi:hypothetical protein GCM10010502_72960 [Kitasatospora aureofaciens]|uniref:Uncharacterized protein n=1 Tax=Kitasatospora aureofaciens TaxID=1894 RepID=A0A8H9I5S2_KITAU|nr:hypothetical protein GCM10010502_72960 [Kitasatospora aureofaciens]
MPPRARGGGAGIRSYIRSHSRSHSRSHIGSYIRSCIGRPGKGRSRAVWRPDRTPAGRCVRTPRSPPRGRPWGIGRARGAVPDPVGVDSPAGPGEGLAEDRRRSGPTGPRGRPAFAGRSPTITAPQGQTPADRTVTHHRPTTYQQAGKRNGQKGSSHFPPVQKWPLSCGNVRSPLKAAGYVRWYLRWCRRCRLRWYLRWCLRGIRAVPGGPPWVGRSVRTASPDAHRNHRPAAGANPEPNRPTSTKTKDRRRVVGISGPPKTVPDMR